MHVVAQRTEVGGIEPLRDLVCRTGPAQVARLDAVDGGAKSDRAPCWRLTAGVPIPSFDATDSIVAHSDPY
ncbi:hypothetical protein AWC31_31355 [Mycolicibacterium wolinskyi]|uniref:Uncharacterized protein n=1 Tax=Mycolicibacterium wolinskyi TaxID=59750 RepID=A0A1X2F270_9MYCO|nr:hypothetical protein AWC31_31355 [Mycolicibacterium wolinskyi]